MTPRARRGVDLCWSQQALRVSQLLLCAVTSEHSKISFFLVYLEQYLLQITATELVDLDVAALGTEVLGEFGRYKHPSWCQVVTTFPWLRTQATEVQQGFS